MTRVRLLAAVVLSTTASGCADSPSAPMDLYSGEPAAHVGAPASSCSLAQLPASAHVVLCFTTTLQPGVWHGWIMELADAQPPGIFDGNSSRSRLNHPYVLAAPQGFTQWGPSDPVAPPAPLYSGAYAFQAEFNGFLWYDVLRLIAGTNEPPQTVPVVVFWADAAGVGGDLTVAIDDLLSTGVVNGGQANALTRKIDQALNLQAKGKDADAVIVLEGFIQQVHDLTDIDLVLSPAQADQLIAWAQYMIRFM